MFITYIMQLVVIYILIRLYAINSPIFIDFTRIHVQYTTLKISLAIILTALIISTIFCLVTHYLSFFAAAFFYSWLDNNNNIALHILFRIADYLIYKYYLNYNIMFLFLVEACNTCNVSYMLNE